VVTGFGNPVEKSEV